MVSLITDDYQFFFERTGAWRLLPYIREVFVLRLLLGVVMPLLLSASGSLGRTGLIHAIQDLRSNPPKLPDTGVNQVDVVDFSGMYDGSSRCGTESSSPTTTDGTPTQSKLTHVMESPDISHSQVRSEDNEPPVREDFASLTVRNLKEKLKSHGASDQEIRQCIEKNDLLNLLNLYNSRSGASTR